jgi:hypothetical protein
LSLEALVLSHGFIVNDSPSNDPAVNDVFLATFPAFIAHRWRRHSSEEVPLHI